MQTSVAGFAGRCRPERGRAAAGEPRTGGNGALSSAPASARLSGYECVQCTHVDARGRRSSGFPPSDPLADGRPVLRKAILAAAESPRLQRVVRRHGMHLGAGRFVAGETLDQAVVVLRRLNERGLLANTTLLGEGVNNEAETRAVVDTYTAILDRIATEGLRVNVALKLTHLGLSFDEALARANIDELVTHAGRRGNFVRLDMEESSFVDPTLRVFRALREDGHENVGTVLQSYLYRSPSDLEALLDLTPNLRFVKGAYLEPPDDRLPREDGRRPGLRATDRALALRRWLHGGCDTRHRAHRPRDLVCGAERHPARAVPVPDALRRPRQASARSRRARIRRPRGDTVRARLVPLPDASSRRNDPRTSSSSPET